MNETTAQGWVTAVAVVLSVCGCKPDNNEPNNGVTNNGATNNGVTNNSTNAGTNNPANNGVPRSVSSTLSPEECQANLEVLRTETSEIRDYPLAHKGNFFGYGEPNGVAALVSLVDDTVVVEAGSAVPGDTDETIRFSTFDWTVAPNPGPGRTTDFPVAVTVRADDDNSLGERDVVLYADANGGLAYALGGGDVASLSDGEGSVTLERFGDLRLGAGGALAVEANVADSNDLHLVRISGPGQSPTVLIREGQAFETLNANGDPGEEWFVTSIDAFYMTEGDATIARVTVSSPDGSRSAVVHTRYGDGSCPISESPVSCGGDGPTLFEGQAPPMSAAAGDRMSAAVTSDGGQSLLFFKDVGRPLGVINTSDEWETLGGPKTRFNEFGRVRVCNRSAYFVASTLDNNGTNPVDELLEVDGDGALIQLTDFRSLLAIESLRGEVPDTIHDFQLSAGCDAVMYTTGPSAPDRIQGYEGYWGMFDGGDTVEIIDETPGRANGNGPLTDVGPALTGLHPSPDVDRLVLLGDDGEFYFATTSDSTSGNPTWNYAVATKPANRCREPFVVNVGTDEPDISPGDGTCDTGATIGGEPACSLRAAIEETNELPGRDEVVIEVDVITPEAPLPIIASRLELEAPSGAVLEGSGVNDSTVAGLRSEASFLSVTGLDITGFPTHGLDAGGGVELLDVSINGNCGWGVVTDGSRLTVAGISSRSSIAGNGEGACEGGGIWVSESLALVELSGVEIAENGGPGILSAADVKGTNLVVTANDGDGVVLPTEDVVPGVRLSLSGDNAITGNRGHGVRVRGGLSFWSDANLDISGNCGWGVLLEGGRAAITPSLGGAATISDNGATFAGEGVFWDLVSDGPESVADVCGGGGIGVSVAAPVSGERSVVRSATISSNLGPGMATSHHLFLDKSTLDGNSGPGVLFATEDNELSRSEEVVAVSGSNLTSNVGSGLEVRTGSVRVGSATHFDDNHGAGIELLNGDVTLAAGATASRNGRAADCATWNLAGGLWELVSFDTCARSEGVYVEDGDITAQGVVIRDNAGAGYIARDPYDVGYGVATIDGSEICDNGAANEAATENVTNSVACP